MNPIIAKAIGNKATRPLQSKIIKQIIKEIIKNKRPNFIQSWIDPVDSSPKLLPYYKNSQ